MSLLDKLQNVEPESSRAYCRMCLVLEALEPTERKVLMEVLAVPTRELNRINDQQISKILKSEGYEVSSNSVYRHRKNHVGN